MRIKNVGFCGVSAKDVFKNGYEALVISGEAGFAPISQFKGSGIREAVRIVEDSRKVNLVRIDSPELGRLVICPSERSVAYKQFAFADFGAPYRDFYYNVSYEAFQICRDFWNATKVAITHLCGGGGRFDENPNIAGCSIEAWLHLYGNQGQLDFVGCCISEATIVRATQLIEKDQAGKHRSIYVRKTDNGPHELFNTRVEVFEIDWRKSA